MLPPALAQALTRHLATTRTWFAARTPAERRILAAAAILVPGIAVLSLTAWAVDEYERLSHRLPEARARFERMQEDADELSRLRALPPSARSSPTGLLAAATAAADARGLALSIAAGPEGLLATGQPALPELVDWLAAVHADLGLRPLRLTTSADGHQIEILLARTDDDTP